MPTYGVSHGYRYNQTEANTTWTITHNLNTLAPVVDCWVEEGGQTTKILPVSVTVSNENQVIVEFSTPRVGFASVF